MEQVPISAFQNNPSKEVDAKARLYHGSQFSPSMEVNGGELETTEMNFSLASPLLRMCG